MLGERDIFILTVPAPATGKISAATIQNPDDPGRIYKPLIYVNQGRRRIAYFTTGEHAQRFTDELSGEQDRPMNFQLMRMKGSAMAKLIPRVDEIVQNDRNVDEYVLNKDDVRVFRKMWKKGI